MVSHDSLTTFAGRREADKKAKCRGFGPMTIQQPFDFPDNIGVAQGKPFLGNTNEPTISKKVLPPKPRLSWPKMIIRFVLCSSPRRVVGEVFCCYTKIHKRFSPCLRGNQEGTGEQTNEKSAKTGSFLELILPKRGQINSRGGALCIA